MLTYSALTANRSIEGHGAGRGIKDAALNTETNDARGELIHHDENPMRSQRCGFTAEQIATPQTVLHVARSVSQDGPPRVRFRPVMNSQDTTNNILVDFNAASQRDLLGDSGTTPVGITPLHFNYCSSTSSLFGPFGQADACTRTKTTSGIFVAPTCGRDRAAWMASTRLHNAKRGLG